MIYPYNDPRRRDLPMIDHDAIAARVRAERDHAHPCDCEHDECIHARAYQDAPVYVELRDAYLDLYDDVQRLQAFMRMIVDDRDRTFVLLAERAEKAEAERDRLRAALSQIAHGRERIDISYREFLDEFVRPLARAALKGDSDE